MFWSKELSRRSPLGIAGEIFSALPPIFKLLVVLVLVNAFLIAAIGSTQFPMGFPSTAIVKSIEVDVYQDVNCSLPLLEIDWGIIEPGQNKTEIAYVHNKGNWEFRLSVFAANWTPPEVQNYMSLSSDYQGQPIPVDSTVRVELVLSLAEDVKNITSFGFLLMIEVEG